MQRDSKHILYGLGPQSFSSKGLWLLALLYFGSLIAGAILSLIAFRATHWFDPDGSSYLASKPYSRFFDRARWVSVLVILPYLFAQCRITSFRAVGFARPALGPFFKWFASGVAMIAMIYGLNLLIGAFEVRQDWSPAMLLGKLDDAILAAMLIACLEEIVFRGLVFRMFYTALKPVPAVLLSSLFFALLHFKAPAISLEGIEPSQIGLWESGQMAWGTAISVVIHFDLKFLLAIFLVGIVLHQVFLLGRNLWACIGIHAGWVFTIKLLGGAFETSETAGAFSGTTRVADGYWVSIALAVFIALFAFLQSRRRHGS